MTNLSDRLERWIEPEPMSGCWLWTGRHNAKGYGNVGVQGINKMAHRVVYELLVGPIPEGLQIDHLCRNKACVNPIHLEPVTALVNKRRWAAWHAERTHCINGHEWTPENTRIWRDARWCRRCRADAMRKHRRKVA